MGFWGFGVLAECEGDDAEGMTLAVGIWEGRGGCDFWGLGANVVGVGSIEFEYFLIT